MTDEARPLIGISACTQIGDQGSLNYKVAEKYVTAVTIGASAIPLIIPPLGDATDVDGLLDRLDGLFLTGSPSNVEPHLYDGEASREGTAHDPARDATTLPLIHHAIERGVPIFAVCRGHQELNVACGGTLHQHLHELDGKRDHRMRRDLPPDARYDRAHPVEIRPAGILERLVDGSGPVIVNSLHSQAIDRLGEGLFVEAVSDDGVIEAVSLPGAKAFTLGVQWHPEHRTALQWPLSQAMFRAFGEAARQCLRARSNLAVA